MAARASSGDPFLPSCPCFIWGLLRSLPLVKWDRARGRTGVPGRAELCLPLLDFDVAAGFVFCCTTYEKKDDQADEAKKEADDESTYCTTSLGVRNNCRVIIVNKSQRKIPASSINYSSNFEGGAQ